MKPRVLKTILSAKKAVTSLVEQCSKDGPVYAGNPNVVAQVSRTGKWLLNDINALEASLEPASVSQTTSANLVDGGVPAAD
jgi:hypothetical protein